MNSARRSRSTLAEDPADDTNAPNPISATALITILKVRFARNRRVTSASAVPLRIIIPRFFKHALDRGRECVGTMADAGSKNRLASCGKRKISLVIGSRPAGADVHSRASRRPPLRTLHQRCAGLAVHKREVVACLRLATKGRVQREVRRFATTTSGLLELAEWLEAA